MAVIETKDNFSHVQLKNYVPVTELVFVKDLNAKSTIANKHQDLLAEATTIILEILQEHPVALQGVIKLVGTSSKLIIVNPYGINCDGCEFINFQQVELRTDTILDITANTNIVGGTFDIYLMGKMGNGSAFLQKGGATLEAKNGV